jgi:hypothetical protein
MSVWIQKGKIIREKNEERVGYHLPTTVDRYTAASHFPGTTRARGGLPTAGTLA